MGNEQLHQRCVSHLRMLCEEIRDRSVGSEGNRRATKFFEQELRSLGWQTEASKLNVVDWEDRGATLRIGFQSFSVRPSPYSLGCAYVAKLASASSIDELEQQELTGKIVLLHGDIAKEQLMPKNFVFYNPDEHRRIIALLEQKQPAAIVSATGRNAALVGGVYPFPLIEDGDFDIPSVYTTDEEGVRLLAFVGQRAELRTTSTSLTAGRSSRSQKP